MKKTKRVSFLFLLFLLSIAIGCGRSNTIFQDGPVEPPPSSGDGDTTPPKSDIPIGFQGMLVIDVAPLGEIGVGSEGPMVFTLTNTGTEDITLTRPVKPDAPFFVSTHGCPNVLRAGANCKITYRFAPTEQGIFEGTLSVEWSAPRGSKGTVNKAYKAIAASNDTNDGTLIANVGEVVFENAIIGKSNEKTLMLFNNSNASTTVNTMSGLSGTLTVDGQCGTIARFSRCQLLIKSKPTSPGEQTQTLRVQYGRSGKAVEVVIKSNNRHALFFTGSGNGSSIAGHDRISNTQPVALTPSPGFTGGARVAVGDIDNDGYQDIVTGHGPGNEPLVRVFSGKDGSILREFYAYTPAFHGGVFVASGDINGDGYDDIITGADAGGGPHARVFSGSNGQVIWDFFPYPAGFPGGVRVASADVNGDGRDDMITGAGPGGGPHLIVYSGVDHSIILNKFVMPNSFTGGLYVAGGDINGDGYGEIIVSSDSRATVEVYNRQGSLLRALTPYSGFIGIRVGTGDVDGDGIVDLLTGAGPGGGPHVRAFKGNGFSVIPQADYFAFDGNYLGGTFVAGTK